jgi:anti-sigma regulatory factor (Ser/Thr protein kinase)
VEPALRRRRPRLAGLPRERGSEAIVDGQEQKLDEAMAEQARCTDRFRQSIGTTGELSAYTQLRSATARMGQGTDGDEPPPTRFAFALSSDSDAAGIGRAEVTSRLEELLEDDELEIACLLLSEVVTNAFLYGHQASSGAISVEGHLSPGLLWIGVTNSGSPFEYSPRLPAPDESHGRGLFVVSSLSDAWGVGHAGGSTSVWFEVARTG